MSAPLYFLPRLKREHVTPAILQARGLGELLRDTDKGHMPMFELTAPGPDGLPGTILSINAPGALAPPRFGYYPQSNDWHKISDDLYLGLDRHDPPQPRDLQRPSRRTDANGRPLPPHPGHLVTCADGRTWEVPIVRDRRHATSLPRSMGWDAAGNFAMQIDPAYQVAWDMTAELVDLFFAPNHPRTIDLSRAAELCVAALALNYRVTRPLVTHARLLTTRDWDAILGALVDYPTFVAECKAEAARGKQQPASLGADPDPTPADNPAQDCPPARPPTVAGPPADSPSMNPAEPS